MTDYFFNPESDELLHKLTRHSNRSVPYERHVADNQFPDQIAELLNTYVVLKYRDLRVVDDYHKDYIYLGRPSDDEPYFEREDGPEDIDQHDVYEEEFRVIRADSSEPFVLIGISKDYSKILVNSTRIIDGDYAFKEIISYYTKQDNTWIGLEVENKHNNKDIDRLNALTVRVDAGEPCYSILVEYLGATGIIRCVLEDECISIVRDYLNEEYDFDAKDSTEYENPLDVDGYTADHRYLNNVMNIDAGRADNLRRLFFNRDKGNITKIGETEFVEPDFDFDADIPEGEEDDTSFDFGGIPFDPATAEGDYDMDETLSVLHKKYNPEVYESEDIQYTCIRDLTEDDIINFRRSIFEGATIYGSI